MANRLQFETSPYLLQHAHNPVDWYPWGEDALRRARQEDRPILLSIGYSACHWCHVMERESFENEAIAALMNELFVNIKVDREERPDVDQIYMTAVQAMTGHGGWPMTMFLTPDGAPYYGGTYFPPDDRRGMPAFPRVLRAAADAYRTRRHEVLESARQITARLDEAQAVGGHPQPLDRTVLDNAVRSMILTFDPIEGGFGAAPKFPQPMVLDLLLRYSLRTKQNRPLEMAELTLRKMAEGGMYDQLGGGFHRYSTDAEWLVPHFEKMLYDNAQLVRVYLAAYQMTANPFYRRIAEETLDYILREMTAPEGGFYSAQDADSEGEEGKYFVWTSEEVREILGDDATLFGLAFDVTDDGNFEGKNILHVASPADEVARAAGVSEARLAAATERGKRLLLERRTRRVAPGRDDKVLTSWNGMMMRAMAEAATILGREDYRRAAEANADFLLSTMFQPSDPPRLLRTFKDGRAHILGYLEDYAHLIDGLLALYEATFESRWLAESQALAEQMLALFWDETLPGFFDTATDHEALISRPRDVFDNATPSGNSTAVDVLLRLAILTGSPRFDQVATTVLQALTSLMNRAPAAFGRLLTALEFALSEPPEIVVVGDPAQPATLALLERVQRPYRPNKVVVLVAPGETVPSPLAEGKALIDGRPTAYVCRNYLCNAPVTDPDALAEQLSLEIVGLPSRIEPADHAGEIVDHRRFGPVTG
ncbi:MAG: thioredoxin domain-containing protein [Dehalococcoidia bacterium]